MFRANDGDLQEERPNIRVMEKKTPEVCLMLPCTRIVVSRLRRPIRSELALPYGPCRINCLVKAIFGPYEGDQEPLVMDDQIT